LLGTHEWVPSPMGRRPATYFGSNPMWRIPRRRYPAPLPHIDSRNNNNSIGGITFPHLNLNVPFLKND
jgi:hypothetical protein